MTPQPTKPRSVRLTDEEVLEALAKGKSHGARGLSSTVRLALKKLKPLTDAK